MESTNSNPKNNPINFLQLKPNSDNNIISRSLEIMHKLLSNNSFYSTSDDLEDLIIDIDDHIKCHNLTDPITFINNFFKNQNNNQSHNQSHNQNEKYYDILSYNCSDNKYNLMLINNQINNPSYLKNLKDTEQKKLFNLLGSSITKYYTNSEAIFGDVFFINIDKKYYDTLLKIDSAENINQIYSNVSVFNLFEYWASTSYIKIYENTCKKFVYYSREYFNNFLKNITKNNMNILDNNIIKIKYEQVELYTKYDESLPNSHNYILNMINKETLDSESQIEDVNNYYFTNIKEVDIKLILNSPSICNNTL
jgi:hypothetical protein